MPVDRTEPLVDLLQREPGEHHRENERHDLDEVAQFDVVSEDEVDGFEDEQLSEEQDRKERQRGEDLVDAAFSGVEKAEHAVLEPGQRIEQELQQDRGEDRDPEGVDDDRVDEFNEQVQDDDVNQDIADPVCEPLLRTGGSRRLGDR